MKKYEKKYENITNKSMKEIMSILSYLGISLSRGKKSLPSVKVETKMYLTRAVGRAKNLGG